MATAIAHVMRLVGEMMQITAVMRQAVTGAVWSTQGMCANFAMRLVVKITIGAVRNAYALALLGGTCIHGVRRLLGALGSRRAAGSG